MLTVPDRYFAELLASAGAVGDWWLDGVVMRFALIAVMVAMLAVPAYAQRMHGKRDQSAEKQQQSAEQQKKAREAEQAYKAALDRIPDKKPPDPWKNMR